MRTWKMEVSGHRKIGRPKRRWSDVIRKYTKEQEYREKKHKTEEHGEWKLDAQTPNREKAEEEPTLSLYFET